MTAASPTEVTAGSWDTRVPWILLPLLGAVIGLMLRVVALWLVQLHWAPFQGVFELLAAGAEPVGTLVVAACCAVVGLGFAGLRAQERLSLAVAPNELVLRRGTSTQRFARSEIGAVHPDGDELVLQDTEGGELTRQRCGLDRAQLHDALAERDYPWRDQDPHRAAYREWTGDSPDLSLRCNALLAERERAVRRRSTGEADSLRRRLGELGTVVRDEGKRQFWRAGPVRPTVDPGTADSGPSGG